MKLLLKGQQNTCLIGSLNTFVLLLVCKPKTSAGKIKCTYCESSQSSRCLINVN